jgi:chromosome segregation ATPase
VDSTILIAGIGLVGAGFSAYLSYRSSTAANRAALQANRISELKVDAEAYDRSQGFYEKLLAEADKHLDRLRTQVQLLGDELERVSNQLNEEQNISDHLRTQVRSLQLRVSDMESSMTDFRRHLGSDEVH